jgi:DNA-binding response OmpR family regulator
LFDLVILDQQLPDSRGIDMMRRVKEQYPALRFMMVSGLMTEDVIQEIKDAGGESVLGKPFDVAELMTAVEKALGE